MPFKDIDLNKLIKQNKVESELLKQITINNKLNTSTLDGFRDKLNAIELVTGKKYELPSLEEKVNQQELLLPITNQLDSVQKQIADTRFALQQPQVQYQNPNAEFLRNTYRRAIGEDLQVNSRDDITAAIQRIGNMKRDIGDKQYREYRNLYDLNEYLKGYRLANFPQTYQRRPRSEPRPPTMIPRRRLPSAPPTIQIENLDGQEGNGLFTSFEEIVEKFKVLCGEMSSGNKNTKLKNEASDILEFLLRAGNINKDQYLKTMDIISKL